MARMNSVSYEKLRCVFKGKFSPQQFLTLKELAGNTVGVNNSNFDVELTSLITLYKSLAKEIDNIEKEITKLIEEANCSLPLIRFDMIFAAYYAKKHAEGKLHRVAITHVSNKLIGVSFALEKQCIDYDAHKLR